MNTYLKLTSTKNDKQNCNCITPFYIDNITGINPNTGRNYSNDDKDIIKTSIYRISNAKGCNVNVCCDANDPTSKPDPVFTKQFLNKFPKIMPMYERSALISIKLSTNKDVIGPDWIVPSPYMICKISKATIKPTTDPTIKIATDLVNDCFTNQCSNVEQISVNNILQNTKTDMKYTYIDDARVSQAILENNIEYVKEYITKYKDVNVSLSNNDYNNRMIHLASESSNLDILNMLIALKANVNIKNKLNETPIHFAIKSNNINAVDALLAQGIDLSLTTTKGETPMFYAMKTGNLNIIQMLYNNNSPLSGTDKDGNNLIHYCVINCPSFKDSNDTNNTDKRDKSSIIKFLIERGISIDQKNNNGITPLELTQKEINRELNKECAENIRQENNDIIEFFFNDSTNTTNPSPSKTPTPTKTSTNNGAKLRNKDISGYTKEHSELLEIQSLLFNNIIKNNPKKYNKYISVDDIPKGAPIEILDTVCYGNGMTGNEDSDECISKGGQLVKIQNRTTKIKLELVPDEETKIDEVDEKDLYFKKNPSKLPKNTIPTDIQNYNNTITNQVPQTTGITYNLGTTSTNTLDAIETTLGFNPQPTNLTINNKTNNKTNDLPNSSKATRQSQIKDTTQSTSLDHPPQFDEYDDFVHKCQKDAISNSQTIKKTIPQTTLAEITQSTIETYKIPLIILSVFIILLIIGIVIYKFTRPSI